MTEEGLLTYIIRNYLHLVWEGPGQFPVEEFAQGLIGFARTEEIRRKMELVQVLIRDEIPPALAAPRLGRSVAVNESMPFAVYSFLKHPKSFEECLFCAILNGGDRDTLGAMAGAISGSYLGIEAMPHSWRQKLEDGHIIESLASSLYQLTLAGVAACWKPPPASSS